MRVSRKKHSLQKPIYLDGHATTPVDPRVIQAMKDVLKKKFGNPSSGEHLYGKEAEALVEESRSKVASLIGSEPDEIYFTSGATESNNLAIKGLFEIYREKGMHLITQPTEHKSVLEVFHHLESRGAKTTYLAVDTYGKINPDQLKETILPETILISVMAANHEIGTLQPISEIGKIAKSKGIFFHVDGSQAVGKIPLNVNQSGIDLLSFSAHKLYGPKGVGVLYVRKKNPRVRLAPLFHGGSQEQGLRSGTLNVPGIVGLGKACEIAQKEMKKESLHLAQLRDDFYHRLASKIEGLRFHGHPTDRLPHNLNVCIKGVMAAELIRLLADKVAASTGSACASQSPEPSYVLKAIGVSEKEIHSSLRFGFGRFTKPKESGRAAAFLIQAVQTLRRKA